MNDNEDILRWKLRGLRVDAAPSQDLWPDIAARLQQAPAQQPGIRPRRRPLGSLAIAASMLLATGLAWQLGQRPAAAPVADPLIQREAEGLVREYRGALDEVARLPQAQLAASYTPAMRQLDSSAELILAAIKLDPDSTLLLEQLRRTYSKRLALAQRATIIS